MIAARNAFASIGIHVPKTVNEWKATASLTENQSYHNAMNDGEAPEMLDPQDNTVLIGSDVGSG